MSLAVINAQHESYITVIRHLKALDDECGKFKDRVLNDLRALKSGEATLDRLTVSDDDYELMPAPPTFTNSAKEEAGAFS